MAVIALLGTEVPLSIDHRLAMLARGIWGVVTTYTRIHIVTKKSLLRKTHAMNASAILLTLLVLSAPPAKALKEPRTHLFVRSIPDEAAILVDGKPLGKTDGLFLIPAGVRRITVELDGYASETRQVTVQGGRITKVEIEFNKQSPQKDAAIARPKDWTPKPGSVPRIKPRATQAPPPSSTTFYRSSLRGLRDDR